MQGKESNPKNGIISLILILFIFWALIMGLK
jgi:hypothetical protein